MATTSESVWRNLPSVYRRAGTQTPAYGLTTVLGRLLVDLERTGQDVLRAHFLDHATDLEDVARLAAWFQLAPWPEEDRDAFRTRVRRMVAIYREGAADALRMLDLVAVAMGAEIASIDGQPAVFIPRLTEAEAKLYPEIPLHGPWPDPVAAWAKLLPGSPLHNPSPYAIYAVLAKPVNGRTWGIPVALLDLPKRRWWLPFAPDQGTGRLEWQVDTVYTGLGDAPAQDTYGDPVVEITAPASHPVTLPVLVNRDLRRLVLVNRTIAPGGVLRVDLNGFAVADLAGPHSTKPLPAQPDLLFATGALLGEHALGQGPPPFHLLRWYTQDKLQPTDDLTQVLGKPGPAPEQLPWPHLLTPLRPDPSLAPKPVHWRLLLGSVLPSGGLWPRQPAQATTVQGLRFGMVGRQAGTFTLLFDRQWLLGSDAQHPLEHRATWLAEQIRRLKLAGVIYVDPQEIADDVTLPPAGPLGVLAPQHLAETITLGDALQVRKETVLHLSEAVSLHDTVVQHRLLRVALADGLAVLDAYTLHQQQTLHLQDQQVIKDQVHGPQHLTLDLAEKQLLTDRAAAPRQLNLNLAEKQALGDLANASVERRLQVMAEEKVALTGTVQMTVTDSSGQVLSVTEGKNRVLRGGRAQAVAALAGQSGTPVFRIAIGADGSLSDNDNLADLLKPIAATQYTVDVAAPLPIVDPQNTLFQLTSTFAATAELTVGESGILIDVIPIGGGPPPATVPTLSPVPVTPITVAPLTPITAVPLTPITAVPVTPITAVPLTPTGPVDIPIPTRLPGPLLYNRAVITPAVAVHPGDKLTVVWTIAFTAA